MNLREVIPGPEDVRRVGDLPLSTKALRAMSVRLRPSRLSRRKSDTGDSHRVQ